MKFLLSIIAVGLMVVSPLIAGTAAARTPSPRAAPRFIVLCDCATPAKRFKIQRLIRNVGGKTVLTYENLGGFAVEPLNVRYLPRLEHKLRSIKGVKSVEADGVAGINSSS